MYNLANFYKLLEQNKRPECRRNDLCGLNVLMKNVNKPTSGASFGFN